MPLVWLALLLASPILLALAEARAPPTSLSRLQEAHPVQALMLGRFSNLEQAKRDARAGRPTAAQGGHEHVTAIITQHPNKALPRVLLAQYFLGTDPTLTFRLRCYEFCGGADPGEDEEKEEKEEEKGAVRMRLYRPLPPTEQVLKSVKYDTTHPVVRDLPSFSLPFGGQLRKLSTGQLLQRDFEYLSGCDVLWRFRQTTFPFTSWPLPFLPRYYHGSLAEGSCTICSQQDPSLRLIAKDDLRLSKRRLDINDRVYTLEGKQVIGSADGTPYRLVREEG